jgi:plasmid maintenance system antidote protein VapI
MPKTITMNDVVRRAIKASGLTNYELWKATGVSQSTLSLFVSGQRGLTLAICDKLAPVLKLKLVVTKN